LSRKFGILLFLAKKFIEKENHKKGAWLYVQKGLRLLLVNVNGVSFLMSCSGYQYALRTGDRL